MGLTFQVFKESTQIKWEILCENQKSSALLQLFNDDFSLKTALYHANLSERWNARVQAALMNKTGTQTGPRHLWRDPAVKLESKGRAGAAHHEISTQSGTDYMMAFIK